MRIGIVSNFFPPRRGGIETYVDCLAKALAKRGHAIVVLCGNDPLPPGTYAVDGIEVRRLPIFERLYGMPLMSGLAKELRALKVDVLHSNFPNPYIAYKVAKIASTRGIGSVLTWHNDLPAVTLPAKLLLEIHNRIVLPRYLQLYRRIIVTTDQYAKSRLLKDVRDRISVVPLGVDCNRFNPAVGGSELRKELGILNRFVVLFVAPLTKWHRYKGLDVLLRSMKISLENANDPVLLVVGAGELYPYFKSMASSLDLDRNVIFAGDVPDSRLPLYYAACDVLALPSKSMPGWLGEGFGLSILEAMASGRPVIASKVGGIPSVVSDGKSGSLVNENDPHALADTIQSFRENQERIKEMGAVGRRGAESYDWELIAGRTERIYFETVS